MNLKLVIAYMGTCYFGWKKTVEGPSIEEELEKVLSRILQEPIHLQVASRTDRGVHAEGQVAHIHIHRNSLDLKKLLLGVNALLPKDIIVKSIEVVVEDFHATLNVKSKIYGYEICFSNFQLPRYRFFSWHFHYLLDVEQMKKGIPILEGTHDFSSFCNRKKNEIYENHIRTIEKIEIHTLPTARLSIIIQGPHFLYKMVRNIVGALAYLGSGKLNERDLQTILSSKDRTSAPITAPAHGLTLLEVKY